jgi:opacity protein-like surface antigen
MRIRYVAAAIAAFALWNAPVHAEGIFTPPSVKDVVEAPNKNPWEGLYVEGGFGLSAGTLEASMGESITFGDTSYVGHVGGGYDLAIKGSHVVVGVLGRYEVSDVAFDAFGENLADVKNSWMVGARLGWAPGPWMIYALGGYRWAKLDPNPEFDVSDVDVNGWVLGGGVEVLLGNGWFAGLEYLASLEAGEKVEGINIDATEHSGKVRVGFKF